MALGFQKMIASYSASYDAILANLKTANEYNIKFKSDMEYSMYRVMIGLIDAEQFENGDIVEGETKYATGGQESPQPDCVGETGVRNDDRAGTGVGL